MMSKLEVLVFFHILGVVVLSAGAGIGMATGMAMGRTDSVRNIGAMSRLAERTEHVVTVPGAVLTLVTGTWFIVDYESFDIGETWLWLSYVLWVIAISLGEGVLAPFHRRLHQRATELQKEGTEQSTELQQAAAAPLGAVTGMALTVLLITFLYLMVFRPGA